MADSAPEAIPGTTKFRVINPKNSAYPFQRKVIITDADKKKEVLMDLQQIYEGWNISAGNLRSKLMQWIADSEGISGPVNTPWEGACAIVKPVIETRINIIHAFFMNIIRPMIGRLFVGVTDNTATPEDKALARNIANFFNSNLKFNKMYFKSVDERFSLVLRDGTAGPAVTWERDIQKRWEVRTFPDLATFLQTYPDPAALGASPEEYTKFVRQLEAGEPLSLDIEYDHVETDMPVIENDELKDLVIYPMTVSDQKRTRFIGRRIRKRRSELKALEKMKVYSNVEEVLKNKPEANYDSVETMQNEIDAIRPLEEEEDYEFIHGRYLYDMDDDGIEEKYIVTYCPQAKVWVQFDKYPFYHNEDFIRLTWFKRRSKRLLGRGVSEMLADLQLESTIQARSRINNRAITDAPAMIGNSDYKEALDPMRPENRIGPGVTLWVPQGAFDKALKPLDFHKKDFGDSMNEESSINQNADNLLGASELRSGRETQFDPRSPAAKTAMLLQQSAVRLDDFVFGFIQRENDLLDMAKKLYYQFGPEKVSFSMEKSGEAAKIDIDKAKFNSENIHLQLSVTSLVENPDFLKAKWEEFYMKYGQEPMLGAIPKVRYEILNQIILNTPEANGVNLLLPLEEIQAAQPPVTAAPAGGPAPAGSKQPDSVSKLLESTGVNPPTGR